MTSFDINNNGLTELNEHLYRQVHTVGEILDNLNGVMTSVPLAVDNKATQIWLDLQKEWNNAYVEMTQKLNRNTLASMDVQQIFNNGDNRSATIMMS
ncbi:hypothetical protein [Saccharothrix longispora]|uniref:hypothetical protein n=1 Tax=Saccharothrix longispora TaxID=33920 RepID=UPI0028FDB01D|nr:hypothetical protein [Saccharothrix longispora]MBY8852424.1 hypothetical protein [Saccharothrix sp. MB29]MDU0295110.1 hypothetical protein [Saccharothrix longispora]